jgi:hypothetical protein
MKALIKSTNKIFDIKETFYMKIFKYDIKFSNENEKESKTESWIKKDKNHKSEGQYYVLTDGNKYYHDDVVVGVDNIREWKLKNIIE